RFLAFFAAGLRAALFAAFFFFLRAGAARFIFFAFVFDFFRFFAMIDLPIVAALVSVQSGMPALGCVASSCKARACSVPLKVPPRRSAPQRRYALFPSVPKAADLLLPSRSVRSDGPPVWSFPQLSA